MHTAFRITNGEPGSSYHQRSRMYRYQPGNWQKEEKKTAAGRNSNDFLMVRVLPIAPDYYMENTGEEKINLTTRENFDYLYRSALNYTEIIGSGLPFHKKKASPRINIINLYKALENILPEHVNLEVRNGRLHFCLYRFHKWPEPRLFWIPLDFTEKLPGQLRGIALEFIRRLMRHHSIQSIKETFQYEMARTYLEDYGHYDGEATAREIRSRARLAKIYEKGKFHRLLERMGKKEFCKDLEGEIQKYHTKKNNEKALLKLIKEGLAYISDDSPSIMQYAYDWSYEESPDFEPVGLDIQIMLTWSTTDAMAEEVETYINSDYHESYAITPVTTLLLTPDTDTPFSMNDFPERFSKWLGSFNLVANNF